MSTRRERAERENRRRCRGCGERRARHFVPPCFGDPGFYICATDPQWIAPATPVIHGTKVGRCYEHGTSDCSCVSCGCDPITVVATTTAPDDDGIDW